MINVTKANGKKEEFNDNKVMDSIRRAKIAKSIEDNVLRHVKSKIYEGIPTSEIYHHIIEFLGESESPFSKSRYSLKEAIMDLGPTGYPFEDFIAEILKSQGFETQTRQILMGKCITHEIDVLAKKDNKTTMIEAKFHNHAGTRSEVHVALYTFARFQDIKDRNNIQDAWLVTNTKTSLDANTYGLCAGLRIMSWNYPDNSSLRELIEKSRLHPITMLTTIPNALKNTLLNNHIVLCKNIHENPSVLNELPLSQEEKDRTLAELAYICSSER